VLCNFFAEASSAFKGKMALEIGFHPISSAIFPLKAELASAKKLQSTPKNLSLPQKLLLS
jgi:hypothetical protein